MRDIGLGMELEDHADAAQELSRAHPEDVRREMIVRVKRQQVRQLSFHHYH